MAKINIQVSESRERIQNALNCIPQIRATFDDIKREGHKLSGDVWEDEGQRIFMDKFLKQIGRVQTYLDELEAFYNNIKPLPDRVVEWDNDTAGLLDSASKM